jgi:hypothetical protein
MLGVCESLSFGLMVHNKRLRMSSNPKKILQQNVTQDIPTKYHPDIFPYGQENIAPEP